jgi:hypothetical protein
MAADTAGTADAAAAVEQAVAVLEKVEAAMVRKRTTPQASLSSLLVGIAWEDVLSSMATVFEFTRQLPPLQKSRKARSVEVAIEEAEEELMESLMDLLGGALRQRRARPDKTVSELMGGASNLQLCSSGVVMLRVLHKLESAEQDLAAAKLQATQRGRLQRKEAAEQNLAAAKLQASVRGNRTRRQPDQAVEDAGGRCTAAGA